MYYINWIITNFIRLSLRINFGFAAAKTNTVNFVLQLRLEISLDSQEAYNFLFFRNFLSRHFQPVKAASKSAVMAFLLRDWQIKEDQFTVVHHSVESYLSVP